MRKWPVGQGARVAAYKPTRTSSNSLCIGAETHSGTFFLLSLFFFFFKSLSWSFCGRDDKRRDQCSLQQQSKEKLGVFILLIIIADRVLLLLRSKAAVMSWDGYISNLTKSEWVDDAAILGLTPGQESVWASAPGGWLSQVTVQHLQTIFYIYIFFLFACFV